MCDDCQPQQPNVPPYPNMADVDPCSHLPCNEPEPLPASAPDCEPVTVKPVQIQAGSDEDPCRTDWKYGLDGMTSTGINQQGGGQGVPPPLQLIYRSVALSLSIRRSNCQPGFVGTIYMVNIPAGSFNSLLSQADANQKAKSYLDSVAQLYANQFGGCMDDTSDNPYVTDINWGGELNCQPGPSIANLNWGWQNGQLVTGCSAVAQVSDIDWGATVQCPTSGPVVSGIEWGNIVCN